MRISSPMVVGRREELSTIDDGLRAAARGTGQALLLIGESGIGKSRLAEEAANRAARSGMPVLSGRAGQLGAAMPLRPLAEALAGLVRSGDAPSGRELEPYRPILSRLVPSWRDNRMPAEVSMVELGEAMLQLLGLTGRHHGCLLILEDLHDADVESLAIIEYLIDNLANLPVFLLGTLRPGSGPAVTLAGSAARRRAATVVEPEPLTYAQVAELVGGCLDCPVEQLPAGLIDRLSTDADGIPFVVEELLNGMTGSGALGYTPDGWQLSGAPGTAVPGTLVRSISDRAEQLGPLCREVLQTASVLGQRFRVSALQAVSGLDETRLLSLLRDACEAHLIRPDPTAVDWYAFRHALTGDALTAELLPAERAAIARRAADTLQAAPQLSEEECQLLAGLRLAAGQDAAAAVLLAEAGRRALAVGASSSAAELLERAYGLHPEPEIGETLVAAQAGMGRLDRALELLAALPPPGFERRHRRADLHTRLAWVAGAASRPDDATAQIQAARQLLDPEASPAHAAALDVVAARLAFGGPGSRQERIETTERLAHRAAMVAEESGMAEVACQAWQLLAGLARRRSYREADDCLRRVLHLADEHRLPTWRVEAELMLAVNEFMRTGELARLRRAHQRAKQMGTIVLGMSTEVYLGLGHLMCGEFERAEAILDRAMDLTARMQNIGESRTVLRARATLAAHRGRRRWMEQELLRFRAHGGEQSQHYALILGLCRAVCALLEEDRVHAGELLDEALAWELTNPTVYDLSGSYGLRPLLEVLAGRAGWPEYERALDYPAAELRWNQQFLHCARAVLLGRSGRGEQATKVFETALATGKPFPMAANLCRRLVAEAALDSGWGEPHVWLRSAEDYFHDLDVPALVNACRVLLRKSGVSAGQRRPGWEAVPQVLRELGVTVREFEVLWLLAEHPGNRSLAQALFISHRTVEKHVASLMTKTGQPNRAALTKYAVLLGLTGVRDTAIEPDDAEPGDDNGSGRGPRR